MKKEMKKIILFAAIIVSSVGFSQAKIEFKAVDNTIDYGTVYKGEDSGKRVFEFKNTGDAPLIITNVVSTCGCTVPTKPTQPIMPGKSDKIEVQYNMNTGHTSTGHTSSNGLAKQIDILLASIYNCIHIK